MIIETLRNIEQAELLLAELKDNMAKIEKADMHSIIVIQSKIEHTYGFPKYCLNARISVRQCFLNRYADTIYRVLTGTNTGIPVNKIMEIMNKNQASEGVK